MPHQTSPVFTLQYYFITRDMWIYESYAFNRSSNAAGARYPSVQKYQSHKYSTVINVTGYRYLYLQYGSSTVVLRYGSLDDHTRIIPPARGKEHGCFAQQQNRNRLPGHKLPYCTFTNWQRPQWLLCIPRSAHWAAASGVAGHTARFLRSSPPRRRRPCPHSRVRALRPARTRTGPPQTPAPAPARPGSQTALAETTACRAPRRRARTFRGAGRRARKTGTTACGATRRTILRAPSAGRGRTCTRGSAWNRQRCLRSTKGSGGC